LPGSAVSWDGSGTPGPKTHLACARGGYYYCASWPFARILLAGRWAGRGGIGLYQRWAEKEKKKKRKKKKKTKNKADYPAVIQVIHPLSTVVAVKNWFGLPSVPQTDFEKVTIPRTRCGSHRFKRVQ